MLGLVEDSRWHFATVKFLWTVYIPEKKEVLAAIGRKSVGSNRLKECWQYIVSPACWN